MDARPCSRFPAWGLTLLLASVLALATPRPAEAHAGVGLLVGPDGTVYFVLFGPYPAMMIRPGGEPEWITPDSEPHFVHHLAFLPDGRLLTATDQGQLFAMEPGVGAESWFGPEALTVFLESGLPRRMRGLARDWEWIPVGGGGDPFAIGPNGSIYALESNTDGRERVMRVGRSGAYEMLAGGAVRWRDGTGEQAGLETVHYGALVWGPDGGLYASERERIRRIEVTDGRVTTLPAALDIAAGMAFEEDGSLLVAESRSGRVVRLDRDGNRVGVAVEREFTSPTGVAVGPDGAIWIKDNPHRSTRIWRVPPGGSLELVAEVDHEEVEEAIGWEPPPRDDRSSEDVIRWFAMLGGGALLLFLIIRRLRLTLPGGRE